MGAVLEQKHVGDVQSGSCTAALQHATAPASHFTNVSNIHMSK
jgi:hypothetical protein